MAISTFVSNKIVLNVRSDDDPELALQRRRLWTILMSAMDQLKPDEREAIFLREMEDMTYEEVAFTMMLPVGNVLSTIFHGRRKLQQLLGSAASVRS